MDNLLFTILAAIVLMGLAVTLLAIGQILTGKSRLKKRCGSLPEKRKDCKGKSSCSLCHKDTCDDKEES